jgi:CRP/FNR family cyclic AMP-dependent transcriptional regulator
MTLRALESLRQPPDSVLMAGHAKLWYLERFGMLTALSDEQRRMFVGMTRTFEAKRGTRIYLPGDSSEQIYIVKSGVVKIARQTADNREIVVALLHSGDIFGELAIIDDAPRDHLAAASEDAVLCEIPRDVLLHLIEGIPQFGLHIMKLIGLRLQRLESRVEELLRRSAHARLAHMLLQLAGQHGIPDSDGVLIPLRLSQNELGRLVGLRRETVNNILQAWREQGLVEAERRAIRLRDPDALRQIS